MLSLSLSLFVTDDGYPCIRNNEEKLFLHVTEIEPKLPDERLGGAELYFA